MHLRTLVHWLCLLMLYRMSHCYSGNHASLFLLLFLALLLLLVLLVVLVFPSFCPFFSKRISFCFRNFFRIFAIAIFNIMAAVDARGHLFDIRNAMTIPISWPAGLLPANTKRRYGVAPLICLYRCWALGTLWCFAIIMLLCCEDYLHHRFKITNPEYSQANSPSGD